ncbi:MAG: hypothetical protein ACM3Q2_17230, partial [Syntrophothermus sp.]
MNDPLLRINAKEKVGYTNYKSCICSQEISAIAEGQMGFPGHYSLSLRNIFVSGLLMIYMTGFLYAQGKNKPPQDTSRTIVQKVEDFSAEDNLFSRLLKNIIVHDDEQQIAKEPQDPDLNTISKYTGKVIRKINVVNLDIFGASVNNPEDSIRSWFQNGGNALHVNTKDWIIKDMLVFSEGRTFIPYYVQESERIIRLRPYIYDVRIVPQKIPDNPDSVDVMVYIQDVWSINGSAAYSKGDKSGSVSFNDINFLGFGNEFQGGLKFDPGLSHGWDWEGSYTYNNIQRTFLSAKLYYTSERYRQQYGLMIGRDFFSPVISWAGGISQDWQNIRYPDLRNQQQQVETVRLNRQDYWLGYAFDIKPFDPTAVNQ